MEWISSTALTVFGWITATSLQLESMLLAGIMLFLALVMTVGLAFALDREESRAMRIIGWLILLCSATAIGCGAIGLAS